MMLMMMRNIYHPFLFILLVLVFPTLEDATPPLSYHVTEEQVEGTLVGNLSADVRLSPEVLSKIHFRFLSDSQPLFIIDTLSGVIRTNDVIDRDSPSLCRYQVTCVVYLDVALQPLQYFQVRLTHHHHHHASVARLLHHERTSNYISQSKQQFPDIKS